MDLTSKNLQKFSAFFQNSGIWRRDPPPNVLIVFEKVLSNCPLTKTVEVSD
jgi:hypothetical protein